MSVLVNYITTVVIGVASINADKSTSSVICNHLLNSITCYLVSF